MKKAFDEWCINVNMNKLMLVVLEALIRKPVALTGDELSFIRSYLEKTATEFGKTFGVGRVAVLNREAGKDRILPALDLCIRLHVLDFLQVDDQDFRAFCKEINLQQLAKSRKGKIHRISIDATTDELKIAAS